MTTLRLGRDMQHRTEESCRTDHLTQLWVAWAERHGFAWSVEEYVYRNLPDHRVMESMDDDHKLPPQVYWELAVEADETTPRPSHRAADNAASWIGRDGMTAESALDKALADTASMERHLDQRDAERQERLARNLADLRTVLPRRIRLGTAMLDELWDCGDRARELCEACRHHRIISESDLRAAIIAVQG